MSARVGELIQHDDARALHWLLRGFRRRLGWEQCIQVLLRGLAVALALVAAVYGLAWMLRVGVPPEFAPIGVALPIGVAAALSILRWPSEARAALVVDRRLGLAERLSTARELVHGPVAAPADPFAPRVRPIGEPVGAAAHGLRLYRLVPERWRWRGGTPRGSAAWGLRTGGSPRGGAAWGPPSSHRVADGVGDARLLDDASVLDVRGLLTNRGRDAERRAVLARLQVANAVASARGSGEAWPSLRSSMQQDLRRLAACGVAAAVALFLVMTEARVPVLSPLLDALHAAPGELRTAPLAEAPTRGGGSDDPLGSREAADRMRVESVEAGLAADSLAEAEADLNRRAQEARARRGPLDRLARALGRVSAGLPAAESLERGDYRDAAEQLVQLGRDADQLSQGAREELAGALRDAASETSANPQLAALERQAADALTTADQRKRRAALQALGERVAQDGQQVESQRELAEDMSQLDQQRRARDQAAGQPAGGGGAVAQGAADGRPGPSDAPAGMGGSPLAGEADGPRDQPGRGQAGGGMSGAGAAPGQGEGQEGTGQAQQVDANAQPAAGPNVPGGEKVGAYQPGNESQRLDVAGRTVQVPVQASGDGPSGPLIVASGVEAPADPAASSTGAASDVLVRQDPALVTPEQNLVPHERRTAVRDYFDGAAAE